MKNINDGPGQKQGDKKDETAYANVTKEKSRNYKEGKDTVNGPNWDKKSKSADGDTGENAGVFK